MQAADGGGGEVFGAERVDHPARVGREGGLVPGELDEQRGDSDAGGAPNEIGMRAEPGPGRQPRFGGGEAPEAGQAVVDEVGALAEQRSVGPFAGVQ
jgi:hypothetical protein